MLTAVGVALRAVVPIITAYLPMFVIHSLLIMAGGTCVCARVAAGMAGGAGAIGPMMVDGEGMVEGSITPGVRVVAVGALALEVVRRPCVAALAVG